MAAAARGEPYRIGFGGRTQMHYAPDVARAFVAGGAKRAGRRARLQPRRRTTAIAEVVATIEAVVPGAAITFDDDALPFPDELPKPWFDSPLTPLAEGVRETVDALRGVI